MTELRKRAIAEHELVDHPFEDDRAAVTIHLYRKPNEGGKPVLLLHGASARMESFLLPEDLPDRKRCLLSHLHDEGFEPWLLDWRGSNYVTAECAGRVGGLDVAREHLDFDRAAEFDVPRALRAIREVRGADVKAAAVGHCMGGAVLAQSLAEGFISSDELSHLVMLTIGLFYSASLESRMKLLDRTLERVYASGRTCLVDPHSSDWGNELEKLYQEWPRTRRAHREVEAGPYSAELETTPGQDVCNRVSFMFGAPYREENLVPEVHERHLAEGQFGPMPLRMYLQGTRNLMRGWAARFDAGPRDSALIADKSRERFLQLERLTILTGARNQLWHRDSADRMWEWLGRSGPMPSGFTKRVFDDYAHQDLLWSDGSAHDIFPTILAGIGPSGPLDPTA